MIKALLLFKNAFIVNPIQNIVCSNLYPCKCPIFSKIHGKHCMHQQSMFSFDVIALQFYPGRYMCLNCENR